MRRLSVAVVLLSLAQAGLLLAQSSNQQPYVMRQDVHRVLVDVVVTDKDGKPIRGLKPGDFTVREDKKPQQVLSFEFADGSKFNYLPPKLPTLPPNTYVSLPSGPERGPLYVLYYDLVNTSADNQMSFRSQMLAFVDKAPVGTRFALFVNMAGLHMVQGFTTDKEALREAIINTKGPGPHIPNAFVFQDVYGTGDTGAALSNLKFISDYLSGLQGHKNVIWLSGNFPLWPNMRMYRDELPDYTLIKQVFASFMLNQVSVSMVDLGGIVARSGGGAGRGNMNSISALQWQEGIAALTGGKAYGGNNRTSELIVRAVDDNASYYTLSYSPTNVNYDGSERQIAVSVAKKKGYHLSYRKLYYALPETAPKPQQKVDLQARFVAAKASDTLYASIEHGAPMIHDLMFSAHLTPLGAPALATAEQMEQLQDSPAFFRNRKRDRPLKPLTPVLLQEYTIGYGIFDPQLKMLAKSKGTMPTLEFAAAAYDADGKLLNSILNDGQATPEARPDGEFNVLFHGDQELYAPPGAAWIRVAVRNKLNDQTGTLEVKLPLATANPVATSGANPAAGSGAGS